MYGVGMNSIRARFTLLVFVSCSISALVVLLLDPIHLFEGPLAHLAMLILVPVIAGPTALTYYLAGRLVSDIRALKASADAIVAGDLDKPVDVDCSCEVGGLANSFREMVRRLNSNIVRMNILAYHDTVTGLTNRTVVQHALTKALEQARPMTLSVLFIDLDGFKSVNDTLGHEAGDDLLRQVAQRVSENGLLRDRDSIDDCSTPYGDLSDRPPQGIVFSRFAGDEFIVVLPDVIDQASLLEICDRIHATLSEPFTLGSDLARVGASIGIARAPTDAQSMSELLMNADMAMYAAKERGGASTVFFDAELRERLLERQQLDEDLRVALENDEFVVHYQAKYDSKLLTVTGYEALVRWQHPKRGLLYPRDFLEATERNNLMCELGGIVMLKVIEQIQLWRKEGRELPVAVNVSPSQFRNPKLVERIAALLRANGVPPRLLEIEVTEQAAMGSYTEASAKMEALRRLGVRLAIDDFGMGYSNLTQLVNMPFDVLKIDKSLVDDIGRFPKSEVVIESLIHLAHQMGQTTVAEGIERLDQLTFLQSVGCDQVQGYLFARPGEPKQVSRLKQTLDQRSLPQVA